MSIMNLNTTIEILDALASGYSPITGEEIENDSVLNNRSVIRALQIAIDYLKKDNSLELQTNIQIDDVELKTVIALFNEQERSTTPNSLTGFYLGTRRFKNENLISHPFYGKLKNIYTNGQLLDFFHQYLSAYQTNNRENHKNPYSEIDFFKNEKFNKLSEKAINQLKEKINELGITKTENLSEYIQNARITYPRAYEPWSEAEKELLMKAIKYTNDLDLLSECFQRGKGSIESSGQRIIYESQILENGSNT